MRTPIRRVKAARSRRHSQSCIGAVEDSVRERDGAGKRRSHQVNRFTGTLESYRSPLRADAPRIG